MEREELAHFEAHLRARLDELKRFESRERDSVELDQSRVGRLSRVDALQSKAMEQATERRRLEERERIFIALERIKEGNYGLCVECEEPIPIGRLKIDPSLEACVDCAE